VASRQYQVLSKKTKSKSKSVSLSPEDGSGASSRNVGYIECMNAQHTIREISGSHGGEYEV
jgi:hypothetical protein